MISHGKFSVAQDIEISYPRGSQSAQNARSPLCAGRTRHEQELAPRLRNLADRQGPLPAMASSATWQHHLEFAVLVDITVHADSAAVLLYDDVVTDG